MKIRENLFEIEDYYLCNSCLNIEAYNEDKTHVCNYCEEEICKQCYIEFEGYCEDCFTALTKENEEHKMTLWTDFWSSRF